MKHNWDEHHLTDLYEIRSGLSKPRSQFGYGFGFLTFKDVLDNYFVPDVLSGMVNSTPSERELCSVCRGDIFLTRTSETMEDLGMSCVALKDYPDATFNGFTKRLRPKTDLVVPEYAAYFLRGARFRQAVTAMSSPSTRASLNNEMIGRLTISLPPRAVQERIGTILKSLDDKIKLNRRMNETLEAMARRLFKSWFVDFDPVHAKAALRHQHPKLSNADLSRRALPNMVPEIGELFPDGFEDSTLGPIPKGWRVGTVGDEFTLTMGQSPPGSTYNELGVGLPFYQGKADFQSRFPDRRVFCTAPTRYAKQFDTLVSVRAPVGAINMAREDCAIGRGLAAVRHSSRSISYTFYAMEQQGAAFQRFESDGTVFGSINRASFSQLAHPVPEADIIEAFDSRVATIDSEIYTITMEMELLSCIRDKLLPRLLSGELPITDI